MKYTVKDFMKEFKHLGKFYKTKKEFKEHLLSGEVTINIPDMIKLINKQQDKFTIDFLNWFISQDAIDLINDLQIVGELGIRVTYEQLLNVYNNK